MKFECYSHWAQLPASVDALFEHCSHDSMFLSREWFETLYDTTFDENQSLLLACVVDKNSVLTLLPLVGANENLDSFSHRYTALYSLLLAEDKKDDALNCLVKGLSQMSINSLSLSPIGEDVITMQRFKKVLEASGYECHQKFFFYNWIHRVQKLSFDEYLAGRPSQLRHTIKRKQRKLAREHEYSIKLFKGEEVKQGLIDYHTAYSASWKAHEQYLTLLDAIAINLAVPDWTRLAILTIDGKAAASQLWFVVHGKASIFRLAYDEEWKRYSPGSILTAYLMQYVIDVDKVEEIDFLTGNEAYKQDWMTERRQRFRVVFIRQDQPQNKGRFGLLVNRLKTLIYKRFNKQKNN